MVVAAAGGVTYAVMQKKKLKNPLGVYRGVVEPTKSVTGVDYDATASMWEDEDKLYKSAAKLDGGYVL